MAYGDNNKSLIEAAMQVMANKNQATLQQTQGGNRFQNLLGIAAMAANQNANPNSEMGRIMGGASNTYMNNLVNKNQGDFRSAVSAIHLNPNLDPVSKMNGIMGVISAYGQNPKDYSDVLNAYGKQIQYQGTSARQAQTDQFRQQQLDMQRQTLEIAQQKANADLEEKKGASEAKSSMVKNQAQDLLSTIGEVEKGIGYFGRFGGLPTEVTPSVITDYGDRKNWEVNIDKLLSGQIVQLMTNMKQASKTGATGFGALSQKELAILQQASTALKKNLDPKDAKRYINQMKVSLQKVAGDSGAGAIYAVNPKNNIRIKSMDGGQTWEKA